MQQQDWVHRTRAGSQLPAAASQKTLAPQQLQQHAYGNSMRTQEGMLIQSMLLNAARFGQSEK